MKKFKKFTACLLSLLLLLSAINCVGFSAFAEDSVTVKSIELSDATVYEGLDAFEDSYYDEANDTDIPWYRYNILASGTVEFSDGSTEEISDNGFFNADFEWLELSVDDPQSYENQWTAGNTYEITATYGEASDTYNVTALENPIKSITLDDIVIYKGINSYVETEYNEITDQDEEYDLYDYYVNGIITFTDGSTADVEANDFIYNEEYYSLDISDSQSVSSPWTPDNTYTATVSIGTVSTEFNVEVKDSLVESIAVDDIVLYEGLDSYEIYEDDTEPYNYYDIYLNGTATLKDGTTVPISESCFMVNDEYCNVTHDFIQDYENQLVAGETYTAAATFAELSDEFTVTVKPSPVKSVILDEIILYKGIDSYTEYEEYDENGDPVPDSAYECYTYSINGTVNFNDGTSVKMEDSLFSFNDKLYAAEDINPQTKENAWKVGNTYSVPVTVAGVEYTVNASIKETPVKNIVFDDVKLYENVSGYYDEIAGGFIYDFVPSFTVNFKDGSSIESVKGYVNYNNNIFSIFDIIYDAQSVDIGGSLWSVGEKTLDIDLMGVKSKININIVKNPYKKLAISGIDELIITLTDNNGNTTTEKAISFDATIGILDYENYSGYLYTDKGNVYFATFTFDISEDGEPVFNKNLTLSLGELSSNTLADSNWLLAVNKANTYLGVYYTYCMLSDTYPIFNGKITAENINAIVTIACMINNYDISINVLQNNVLLYDAEDAKAAVEEVFGIKDIDLTNYVGLNINSINIMSILNSIFDALTISNEIVFENNNWILSFEITNPTVQKFAITLDKNYVIQKIEIISEEDNDKENIGIGSGSSSAETIPDAPKPDANTSSNNVQNTVSKTETSTDNGYDGNVVQTGDNSNLGFAIIIMIISLAVLVPTVILMARKEK